MIDPNKMAANLQAEFALQHRAGGHEVSRDYLANFIRQWSAPALVHSGAALIAAERQRQQSALGWSREHDDTHDRGELIAAAMCYASVPLLRMTYKPQWADSEITEVMATKWPWDEEWWKPSDSAVRNLVKAGALIAAEIDRLQRAVSSPNNVLASTGSSNTRKP